MPSMGDLTSVTIRPTTMPRLVRKMICEAENLFLILSSHAASQNPTHRLVMRVQG